MNFIKDTSDQLFEEANEPRFRQFANDTVTPQYIRSTMMYVHGRRTTTETFVVPFERSMKIPVPEAISHIFGVVEAVKGDDSSENISAPFPNGLPSDTGIERLGSRSAFAKTCLEAKNGGGGIKVTEADTNVGRIIYRNEVPGDGAYRLMRRAISATVAVHYRFSEDGIILCKVDTSTARKDVICALSTCNNIDKTMWKAAHWSHKEVPKVICGMVTITCPSGLFIAIGKISELREITYAAFLRHCYIRHLGIWFPGVRPRHGVLQNMDGVLCNIGKYRTQITQAWIQGSAEQKEALKNKVYL